jgi:hypothetical protein
MQQRLLQLQTERDSINTQINQEVETFRQGLGDDFLTNMRALSDLSGRSASIWWISTFVVLLIVGIEITPVMVKLLSPIGPYDVKLDAMNSVETTEALLKRDTANRILTHHYAHVETAERQADDTLIGIRTKLADQELQRKAGQWQESRAAGANATLQQFIDSVRTEILTGRNPG